MPSGISHFAGCDATVILVDSSIWVHAWRGRPRAFANALAALIEAGEAVINPLIYTELLQGALNEDHQEEIAHLLTPIPVLPFPEHLWSEGAKHYLRARQKGITPTTIDCLIATHASLAHCPLWSTDGIFPTLGTHISLRLFVP